MAHKQKSRGGEGSHSIKSLKHEKGRGHTVAIEDRVHLTLHEIKQHARRFHGRLPMKSHRLGYVVAIFYNSTYKQHIRVRIVGRVGGFNPPSLS